ncbi:hypothetical protein [Streptomyces sp. NPDC006997]|uniref:hypothetical protein n=1 Tax=Streptomyces sp. NPDC006997 TaxID=3155356 RepID=UPI0033F35E45
MTHDQTLHIAALGAVCALAGLALLIGLGGAAYVAICRARDTYTDRRARRAARAQAAAIEDTVTRALDAACCETWWVSLGAAHDPACPHQHQQHQER